MSPDKDILEEAEFENQINALADDQVGLIKFVARQQYDSSKIQVDHGRRIRSLERRNKKVMGGIGVMGAIIATAATATIDYFLKLK